MGLLAESGEPCAEQSKFFQLLQEIELGKLYQLQVPTGFFARCALKPQPLVRTHYSAVRPACLILLQKKTNGTQKPTCRPLSKYCIVWHMRPYQKAY